VKTPCVKDLFYCTAVFPIVQERELWYHKNRLPRFSVKSAYAPVMELVDMRDLGAVTLVKVFSGVWL
jgi:hypothetical protein